MSCNTTFSMFKLLRTQQRLHTRTYHTSRPIDSLPKKNIFNTSEIEIRTNAPELLEDLYDRNNRISEHLLKEIECAQKIIKILRHQNIIAINHTYHEAPLDLIKLQSIEDDLKKNLDENFKTSLTIHQFTLENKVRSSHADQ